MRKSNKLLIGLFVVVVLGMIIGNVLIKSDVKDNETNKEPTTTNEPAVIDSVSADTIK